MNNLTETLTALHEEVRQFVEKQFPEYKVTYINSDGRTEYRETKQSVLDRIPDPHNIPPEYILSMGELSYRVTAYHKVMNEFAIIEVRIDVLPDGKLYMGNPTIIRTSRRYG